MRACGARPRVALAQAHGIFAVELVEQLMVIEADCFAALLCEDLLYPKIPCVQLQSRRLRLIAPNACNTRRQHVMLMNSTQKFDSCAIWKQRDRSQSVARYYCSVVKSSRFKATT